MPLPRPEKKESKKEFISRCMSALTKKGEGEGTSQRFAMCNSQYKRAKAMELTSEEIRAIDCARCKENRNGKCIT